MDQLRVEISAPDRSRHNGESRYSFVEFKKEQIEQSISSRFERQVDLYKDCPAVKSGAEIHSYDRLNRQANRLARAIVSIRGNNSEAVALMLPQGPDLIAAVLAVLKAGKFYLGLDPFYPPTRLQYMLEDSGARVLITNDKYATRATNLIASGINVLNIDALEADVADDNLNLPISPDDVAYIFYTSGSTGQPKGVFDCHRNVLHNVMRYTNSLAISKSDRLSLLQSSSFSGSVSSLFCAVLNGACSYPFEMRGETPEHLARWLCDEEITIYHSMPTLFRRMLATGESFPHVRIIRLEGDQASNLDVNLFHKYFADHCRLVNGLGTTETGLVCQFFVGRGEKLNGTVLPVGYPVSDMEVMILNEARVPMRAGQTGQIAIRSRFLACGYWNDQERTRQAFIKDEKDPSLRVYITGDIGRFRQDGCLEHLGRSDSRVKVRGQTVAFAEIENALLDLDTVTEAAVGAYEDSTGDTSLVAYYKPTHRPGPTVSELRRCLEQTLPEYEIPSTFVTLDELPRDPNGKIDRKSLPHPSKSRPSLDVEYIPAQSLVQLQLVQILEEMLNIKPVGILDNFFDLGGHSLLALNLMLEIHKMFDVELPPSTLLAGATVKQIASVIQDQGHTMYQSIVPIREVASGPALFYLHGDYNSGGFYCLRLVRHIDGEVSFYALPPLGLTGGEIPGSYGKMADYHLADIKRIQPQGPYLLGGTCNGGLVAFEIARRLEAQGDKVALLALFSASAANLRFRRLGQFAAVLGHLFDYTPEQQTAVFLRLREIATGTEGRTVVSMALHAIRKSVLVPRELMRMISPQDSFLKATSKNANIRRTYSEIDSAYLPDSYQGKVTLLWPNDEPETPVEAVSWWKQIADHVELYALEGTHHSCLTKDARLLGAVLNDCCATAITKAH